MGSVQLKVRPKCAFYPNFMSCFIHRGPAMVEMATTGNLLEKEPGFVYYSTVCIKET